jgi:hypothetical protein
LEWRFFVKLFKKNAVNFYIMCTLVNNKNKIDYGK